MKRKFNMINFIWLIATGMMYVSVFTFIMAKIIKPDDSHTLYSLLNTMTVASIIKLIAEVYNEAKRKAPKHKTNIKRHINYKNLGWMISTTLFYVVVYPFIGYNFITRRESIDISTWVFVSLIAVWYVVRNRKIGYYSTYWNDYFENKKHDWVDSKVALYAEQRRTEIEHTQYDDTRIAK